MDQGEGAHHDELEAWCEPHREAHSVEMQELDEQGQQELAALSLDADQEEVNAI